MKALHAFAAGHLYVYEIVLALSVIFGTLGPLLSYDDVNSPKDKKVKLAGVIFSFLACALQALVIYAMLDK